MLVKRIREITADYVERNHVHKYEWREGINIFNLPEEDIELKYASLDPDLYKNIWEFLPIIRYPRYMERRPDAKCAEEFKQVYTEHCEKITHLMLTSAAENLFKNRTDLTELQNDRAMENYLHEYCPCFPKTLLGRQTISKVLEDDGAKQGATMGPQRPIPKHLQMEPVQPGGAWSPSNCRARQRVAVIIPYRDRKSHLKKLLAHLHPMLQRQQLDYRIFVIEQNEPLNIFNKGMLMNSGFTVIHGSEGIKYSDKYMKSYFSETNDNTSSSDQLIYNTSFTSKNGVNSVEEEFSQNGDTATSESELTDLGGIDGISIWGRFDCFIFHDVDMIPEDDRNMYTCSKTPRHVGNYIDKFNYKRCCGAIFGGVTSFTSYQFIFMNGFSNVYYGWGAEDSDMGRNRMTAANYPIVWYPRCVSRFSMIKHGRDTSNGVNPYRYKILNSLHKEKYNKIGLSSLSYRLKKSELKPLYTYLVFDLPEKIKLWDGTIIPKFKESGNGKQVRTF